MLYTHMSLDEIKNLTIIQYNELLLAIQNKQLWDLQNHTVAMSGEFDEEVNPLYLFEDKEEVKKMTLADMNSLMSMLG